MAVGQSTKGLHKHSLPIIILASVLLGTSIVAFGSYTFTDNGQSTGRDFVTNVVSVKASANGLAHISLMHDQAAQLGSSTTSLQGVSNLGQVTELTVSLQSAKQ